MIQLQNSPRLMYGTAWKEDRTAELTFQALESGFRAIDTANQRKHYFEEGVGQGIQRFLGLFSVTRGDLFLQTKFTFARGQDHRKPYDENDDFTHQVKDSFASSLQHLQTDYIDSYVLHGPYSAEGIGEEDLETWRAMETLLDNGQVRYLGVSNVSAAQLAELCARVRTKPTFVQNRCFARMGWDREVREICAAEHLVYQGFSLLTANRQELAQPQISSIALRKRKTLPQIIFRFCGQLGMICLTGTSDKNHMMLDLDISDFELTPAEVSVIENIAMGAQ